MQTTDEKTIEQQLLAMLAAGAKRIRKGTTIEVTDGATTMLVGTEPDGTPTVDFEGKKRLLRRQVYARVLAE